MAGVAPIFLGAPAGVANCGSRPRRASIDDWLVGGGDGPRISSCRRAFSTLRSISTMTDGGIFGRAKPTSSLQSQTTSQNRAGNPGQSWGRRVRVPATFDQTLIGLDQQRRSEEEWGRLGVVLADGTPLPATPTLASLVQPAGPGGAVYLVYDNYRTILRWNRSLYFATAVGSLADRLSSS